MGDNVGQTLKINCPVG